MKRKVFYFIVLLQVLFLAGMILANQSIIWAGREIMLETEPIDPHSLFSGEYVALNYDISTLELDNIWYPELKDNDIEGYFTRGSRVYVQLVRQGEVWKAVGISKSRSDMDKGMYISGRIRYFFEGWQKGEVKEPARINIAYGIESYYLPEGKARHYEGREMQGMKVKVALDQLGRSKVLEILPPQP